MLSTADSSRSNTSEEPMFKVEAVVNGEQLETLLLAAKAVGVTLALGVVPDEARRVPSSRKQKRYTKKKLKRHAKVRLLALTTTASPRLVDAHAALAEEFGSSTFDRALAKGVIAKRAKIKHASGYVTQLARRGALIQA
jgi:hypothetical protein